jgi:hypothetical protein
MVRRFWILAGAAMLLLMAVPAFADWNPGDPAKWVQLPDLTPTGIDIEGLDICSTVADDWLCTTPGLITDIHIWASWLGDSNSPVQQFTVRIWADAQPDGQVAWSRPLGVDPLLDPLYTKVVKPAGQQGSGEGYFTERVLPGDYQESFWRPNCSDDPMGTDTKVYQYNMYFDPDIAFMQQGTIENNKIYWLEIAALHGGTTSMGWKTRNPSGHWGDDAVYLDTTANIWKPLVYHSGGEWGDQFIPLDGKSIDLAFVLTPEPGSLAALATGLIGLVGLKVRKRK